MSKWAKICNLISEVLILVILGIYILKDYIDVLNTLSIANKSFSEILLIIIFLKIFVITNYLSDILDNQSKKE